MSLPPTHRAAAGPGAPEAPDPGDLGAALTHGLAIIEAFDQDRRARPPPKPRSAAA